MEVILVVSGKGGTGKTTFTANLASTFSQKGYKTGVIDLDLHLGKMDLVLGLESKVEFNLSHIISKKATTIDALIKDKKSDNLFLLAAPKGDENPQLNKDTLSSIIEEFKKNQFDFVLLDCPSGIEHYNPTRTAFELSNTIIVVTNQEKLSLRDADSIIGFFERETNTNQNIQLVINKYIEPRLLSRSTYKSKEIQRILDIPLLGVISNNSKFNKSINEGTPAIYKNGRIKNEFFAISEKLLNDTSTQKSLKK